MARPLIGVTKPNHGDRVSFWAACLALRQSGARTMAITADHPGEDIRIDGLLLGGGTDVHPSRFDMKPKPGYAYDERRDAMELAWVRRAHAQDLPTLGICRGAQFLNVAAGGGLHMDVTDAFTETRYPQHWFEQAYFRKRVMIEPASQLHAIVGADTLWVNSIHRQAVHALGQGLRIAAREENGAIQAIEDPSKRFWLGLQFHPEFMVYRTKIRRIFSAFVAAAAASKGCPRDVDSLDDGRRRVTS
jgi:putative glutamine amidotransferase